MRRLRNEFPGRGWKHISYILCQPFFLDYRLRNEFPGRGWKRSRTCECPSLRRTSLRNEFPGRGWKPRRTKNVRVVAPQFKKWIPRKGMETVAHIDIKTYSHCLRNEFPGRGWKQYHGDYQYGHAILFKKWIPRKGMETFFPTTFEICCFTFKKWIPRKGMETRTSFGLCN